MASARECPLFYCQHLSYPSPSVGALDGSLLSRLAQAAEEDEDEEED